MMKKQSIKWTAKGELRLNQRNLSYHIGNTLSICRLKTISSNIYQRIFRKRTSRNSRKKKMNSKKFFHLLTIMMVAMVFVLFSSCNNDDDNKVNSPIIPLDITVNGKQLVRINSTMNQSNSTTLLQYNSNGQLSKTNNKNDDYKASDFFVFL